ncbi:MAG: peptidase T [Bacteroidia bacterium]|jgi:tripeptide aminopeptidase|nr:peptidase T [Bacteroidia bacterium]
MKHQIDSKSLTERFCRYVQIDTQSDPNSTSYPSTEKQKNLGKLLVQELQAMGIRDAHLDEFGYVYATVPATSPKEVPVICFCSHMDTSPDCTGENVKPIIHHNYQGGIVTLPADPKIVLDPKDHPDLKDQIGHDIITADGTTLLGADNKAGVAEIMEAVRYLTLHPECKHGTIRILFTPDEEIGRGVDKVDMQKLGAQFGYTMDGETAGHLEDETFSADGVVITIQGVPVHPGFAKGKMENALKIASAIVANLPANGLSPETTEGKEPFMHPTSISGSLDKAEIKFIIRAFDTDTLGVIEQQLEQLTKQVIAAYPNSTYTFEVIEQYRNMKLILDQYPDVSANALEAITRAGLNAQRTSIRGGTDGSRLSFMGLPCPNIFAGEHAFHGKQEWVSVQDMQKATEVIIHLCEIWEEKTKG